MATLNFDATQVEPSTGKDPLPAGKYLVVIVASQMKPTKNGSGQYLELEYQVLDGGHKGRKLWSRHNLNHPNAQTVAIARGELSAICRSISVLQPKDSVELHNLPLVVTVKLKRREDNQELSNEVSAWAKKDVPAGAPQQAGVGGPATPPWLRKG